MSVYYVYEEGRFSLLRKSLIGVLLKFQVYGRSVKLVTFPQLCGYVTFGGSFWTPTYLCILPAPQDRRVTLLS